MQVSSTNTKVYRLTPEELRELILKGIHAYFEIDGGRVPDNVPALRDAVAGVTNSPYLEEKAFDPMEDADTFTYRAWTAVNSGVFAYQWVSGVEHAGEVILAMVNAQAEDENVETNMFGLETWNPDTEDWEEWTDDDGNTIMDQLDPFLHGSDEGDESE